MKSITPLILTCVMLASLSALSHAAEPANTGTATANMKPHHGMGMWAHGMTDEDKEAHLKAMQDYSLKIHDLSNQILAEKDPTKQEALKTQQRELMKEHYEKIRQAHKM